jgi:hypothetical protein
MRKTIATAFCILGLFTESQAQSSLSLPFFDDFARFNQLDPVKWQPEGGVFINNTYSKTPLTRNIATLNAVSADGKLPPITTTAVTPIDTLTSRPINLAGFTAADSVYLSFYLQAGGAIWNAPASGAYFLAEFKDNAGAWQEVLRLNGPLTGFNDFKQVFIAVKNPTFLHAAFQFRFRNVGRNGFFRDNWNLDHVFLNNNRTVLKGDTFDIATSKPLTSLLKRYTAMPIQQFNANIAGELSDSITTTVNNLSKSQRSVNFDATVKVGNTVSGPFNFSSIPAASLGRQQSPVSPFAPAATLFAGLSGFQDIKTTVYLIPNESGVDTRYNDTISRVTQLYDFYAYDDGSVEDRINAKVPVTLGQVAVKFKANQPDMVKELRVYIPKVSNTPGTTATFRIWMPDATTGNPSPQSVFTSTFVVPPLSQLDNWFIVPVNPPVPVNGEFYIGWSVINAPNIFSVGLDLNEKGRGMVRFYIGSNSWSTVNANYAIMLRPVMNNNITGMAEENLVKQTVKLFPNPATAQVTIQGEFDKGILLDATGRQVRAFSANSIETQLDLQNLPAGLYLVKLQTGNVVQTHKLIIKTN